jgi:putative membrane protein
MMSYGLGGFGPFGFIGMGIGLILHVAIVVLVIVGAVKLFKSLGHTGRCHNESTDALQILKLRYAKGEITAEEYASMKKVIE